MALRITNNKFKFIDEYVVMELYNREHHIIAYTLYDICDHTKCLKHLWYIQGNGYVENKKVGKMHNYILNRNTKDRKIVCDHFNGNKLDNRRKNLRIVTQSVNNHNKRIYRHNTSGFRGVTWSSLHNKWRARIILNSKTHNFGLHEKPEDAINLINEFRVKNGLEKV